MHPRWLLLVADLLRPSSSLVPPSLPQLRAHPTCQNKSWRPPRPLPLPCPAWPLPYLALTLPCPCHAWPFPFSPCPSIRVIQGRQSAFGGLGTRGFPHWTIASIERSYSGPHLSRLAHLSLFKHNSIKSSSSALLSNRNNSIKTTVDTTKPIASNTSHHTTSSLDHSILAACTIRDPPIRQADPNPRPRGQVLSPPLPSNESMPPKRP